jgi:hypothetical protein
MGEWIAENWFTCLSWFGFGVLVFLVIVGGLCKIADDQMDGY